MKCKLAADTERQMWFPSSTGLLSVIAAVCCVSCGEKQQSESAPGGNDEKSRREEVRGSAAGQFIGRLETSKGDVYENVTIREVSAVGITIRHDSGSRRIPFEELPAGMRERFLFDPKEKEAAIAREHVIHSASDASHDAVEAVTAAERKKDGAAAYRKKVMMTLASKEARISSLQGEIYDLEREIQNEEDKKIHRREYYRRIGGISRAPILRQDVANKRQEITTLNQQVAALRVELDSISR